MSITYYVSISRTERKQNIYSKICMKANRLNEFKLYLNIKLHAYKVTESKQTFYVTFVKLHSFQKYFFKTICSGECEMIY